MPNLGVSQPYKGVFVMSMVTGHAILHSPYWATLALLSNDTPNALQNQDGRPFTRHSLSCHPLTHAYKQGKWHLLITSVLGTALGEFYILKIVSTSVLPVVPVTHVPGHRASSDIRGVVGAEREALLVAHVEELVFLHNNLQGFDSSMDFPSVLNTYC